MFITKKRFNEEITKAVMEAREKDYQERRISDIQHDLYDRICRESDCIHRRADDLEKRIRMLERMHDVKHETGNPSDPECVNPIGY